MSKKILATICIICIILGSSYFYVSRKMQGRASNSNVEKKFVIESGQGVNQISTKMEERGIITNNVYFDLYIWKKNKEDKIVTGTYVLRPNMTIPEIVDIITSGKAEPKDLKITIIEGWNNKNIGEYFAREDIVSQENFTTEVKNVAKYQEKYSFLGDLDPLGGTLEGFLFPDTYLIYPDATAEMIVIKMLNNFDKKLTDTMKQDITRNNRAIKEIITLASIIEKEVPNKEDQKVVAGIFWERLKNNYPLQSCATINYILGTNKKKFSFDDTRVDSPYNTYTHKGLPPGPISNPGLNAIMAAIYPQTSDYYYFLSNPQTGETVYSRTIEEHNRNKEANGL